MSERRACAQLSEVDPRDVVLDHIIDELILVGTPKPDSIGGNSSKCKLFATHEDITKEIHDGLRRPTVVFDQGRTSICVASTAATIINLQYDITDANPFWIYNCRQYQTKDDGMAVKNCTVIGFRYGVPNFQSYPIREVYTNPDGQPTIKVTSNTIQNALKHRFTGYGRVYSLQTVINILRLNRSGKFKNNFGGLFLVLPMRNSTYRFWDYSEMQRFLKEDQHSFFSKKDETGYHCVTLLDVDEEQQVFKLQNSWGPEWGNYGCTYFPFEDWIPFMAECWFATNSDEVANRIKSQVIKLRTFHNHANGQLNADNRYNVVYNMSTLNKQLGYKESQTPSTTNNNRKEMMISAARKHEQKEQKQKPQQNTQPTLQHIFDSIGNLIQNNIFNHSKQQKQKRENPPKQLWNNHNA